jgi:hypothetical protein
MLVSSEMITGFNTDVPHEGHVYHVQTEDGGEGNPILESLVYIGGTIVAKKLTPYPGPLNEDPSHEALTSMLKRQHQVIIAAIKAGRIEELIRHSMKQQTEQDCQSTESSRKPPAPPEPDKPLSTADQSELAPRAPAVSEVAEKKASLADGVELISTDGNGSANPGRVEGRTSNSLRAGSSAGVSRGETAGLNLDQVLEDYVKRGGGQAKLEVKVLTPEIFTAGSGIGLRVQVTHDTQPDFDATVTVKVIGTAFKPQVFIGRVGRDGVASFSLTLPSFSTGTAAIVIEAQSGSGRGELKKLIRRA